MKKTHQIFVTATVLMLISFVGKSYCQAWIYFTGEVTEINSGNQIPGYPVLIASDDSTLSLQTITNQDGSYLDSVYVDPAGIENVTVSVFDCNGTILIRTFQQPDSVNIADFSICTDSMDCMAYFEALPDSSGNYSFHFINLSQGDFTGWEWSFGDGTASGEFSPFHQFNAPGIYQVCLSIYDSVGSCNDFYCTEISIDGTSCSAGFVWQAYEENPLQINFFDLSEGNITNWLWDFGDSLFSTLPSPVHTYAESGRYLVNLTVYDTVSGCSDVLSKWVDVGDTVNCVAAFEAILDTLNNTPYVYFFKDESSGNPQQWLWNFGDGEVSFQQNPVHTYQQEGTYEVCLTVSSGNEAGDCFDQTCQTITTPAYFDFGGQVFIGDYPLNIEENDSANKAVALLYRRFNNQWKLMDSREFWKFGYYWFVNKPVGEYLIHTAILPGSDDFESYIPQYHYDALSWTTATVFKLEDDAQFDVDIHLDALTQVEVGSGYVDGNLVPSAGCEETLVVENRLVYLFNESHQVVAFTRTDVGGAFAFYGLGPGKYAVKAEITGLLSRKKNLTLNENNLFETNIPLEVDCESYVGINENEVNQDKIIDVIYPQPATDRLFIAMGAANSSGYHIEFISIDGRVVKEIQFNVSSDKQIVELDVSVLVKGVYLIKISDGAGLHHESRKILIN